MKKVVMLLMVIVCMAGVIPATALRARIEEAKR